MTYDASNNVNPYAPGTFQRGDSTPGLDDLIAYAIKRTALGIRVCLPARVIKVRGPQFVDLQPLLQQRVFTDLVDYPIVPGALVSMPVGLDYAITLPLAPGDTGLLICADRALDAYIASDGSQAVDPASQRCHNLTDAIFLPGLVPYAKQTAQTTDMVLRNGQATLSVQKAGTFKFANQSNEMVDLLCQIAAELASLAGNIAKSQSLTALGPAALLGTDIANMLATQAKVQALNTRLQTLKGT